MKARMSLISHGWFPAVVYRSFDEKIYAEQFIEEGRFRIREIKTYTKIEDVLRRDVTEGTAHVKTVEPVVSVHFPVDGSEPFETTALGEKNRHSSFASNQVYALCCSLKYPNGKFGDHSVEIADPKALARDISVYVETLPWKVFGGVEGVSVEYTKETVHDSAPNSVNMARLSYAQKPDVFSSEKEFRFVTIQDRNKYIEYLEIDLGKRLEYAKLLGE
jgi:hypothetical protein